MTYLEELLNKCDLLRVVINPPHPQAFIQGRTDQATILLAELEKEISEIERQDAPTFEMVELKEKLYDDDSGRCYYCGKDTLWGEAAHTENCVASHLVDGNGLIWVGFERGIE